MTKTNGTNQLVCAKTKWIYEANPKQCLHEAPLCSSVCVPPLKTMQCASCQLITNTSADQNYKEKDKKTKTKTNCVCSPSQDNAICFLPIDNQHVG